MPFYKQNAPVEQTTLWKIALHCSNIALEERPVYSKKFDIKEGLRRSLLQIIWQKILFPDRQNDPAKRYPEKRVTEIYRDKLEWTAFPDMGGNNGSGSEAGTAKQPQFDTVFQSGNICEKYQDTHGKGRDEIA